MITTEADLSIPKLFRYKHYCDKHKSCLSTSDPEPRCLSCEKEASELEQLRAENARLSAENERLRSILREVDDEKRAMGEDNARLRAVAGAAWVLCHNPKERWHEPEWVFRDELIASLDALDKDGE